jgi:hypothetical protein
MIKKIEKLFIKKETNYIFIKKSNISSKVKLKIKRFTYPIEK